MKGFFPLSEWGRAFKEHFNNSKYITWKSLETLSTFLVENWDFGDPWGGGDTYYEIFWNLQSFKCFKIFFSIQNKVWKSLKTSSILPDKSFKDFVFEWVKCFIPNMQHENSNGSLHTGYHRYFQDLKKYSTIGFPCHNSLYS